MQPERVSYITRCKAYWGERLATRSGRLTLVILALVLVALILQVVF